MSLQTVVEVALHFESFRNVDLFHQGLYHLKTRLYRDDGEQRLMAIPYAYSTSPVAADKPKAARTDHHNLIPAHIIDDQYTFSTRSYLIRYCEEEVELNDIGQFRIEVGLDEGDLNTALTLEVDLMFADLTQHGGADRFGDQPDVDSTEFKSVSTQVYRIHRFGHGLHECCPVVFDEFHFCLANLVVHTCILDYRFRLRPMLPIDAKPQNKSANGDANSIEKPTVPIAQNGALSLVESIYGSHRGASREDLMQVTEAFYQKHLGVLAGSYAKLVAFFEEICSKCLTPAQVVAFADVVDAPDWAPFDTIPVQPHLFNGDVLALGASMALKESRGTLRSYLVSTIPATASAQVFAMQVASDLSAASCQVLKLWHRLLTITSYSCREITALLRRTWEERMGSSWSRGLIKDTLGVDMLGTEAISVGDSHNAQSVQLRLSEKLRAPSSDFLSTEDLSLTPDCATHPILFEQRYRSSEIPDVPAALEPEDYIPSAPKRYRGVHLFVLVHGWQGNSFDMRLMKNNLALLFPDAIFLCATANEDNTEGDMNESGIRLAQEVTNYICDWCPGSALGRLSFITFSCGGLIVRAALPLMQEYSSKMYTLLMLSCQHLGFLTETMSLVSTGLWGLKKWRQSKFLEQMTMGDSADPKETFIYRLSKTKGFEFFKWVALVSCKQDQFAPFWSARAVMPTTWENKPDKEVYASMVRNMWEPVAQESVIRFDVNFAIPENNLDAVIGRAAHIRFLECQPIMKMIMHNYSFMFR